MTSSDIPGLQPTLALIVQSLIAMTAVVSVTTKRTAAETNGQSDRAERPRSIPNDDSLEDVIEDIENDRRLYIPKQQASQQADATPVIKELKNLTEEARLFRNQSSRRQMLQRTYEPLDRWHAPPTLAGPLFTLDTVYSIADAAPIVTTDLGPGVRLGSVAPIAGQMTVLQSIIVGSNYAAISVTLP